ncbi:RuvA C-terminal domain-containing protein [Ktedonobacter robiniae]|uniref:Uncharacterized protein n=1 Tax=Ktedonobacter robiniae TaxID=2778365 RepID=A0ABQ3V2V9_9CHLR|nr:RuvA C-terminal domain-containing protein [Ktedonobacter robiniae]GHO59214.1 hypothetical protein KSB_76890 [Ktedonobacter robiniae]
MNTVHQKVASDDERCVPFARVPSDVFQAMPSGVPLPSLLEDIGEVIKCVDDLLDDVERCRSALLSLGYWTIDAKETDATQALLAHVSIAQEGLTHLEALIREGICQPMRQELLFFEASSTPYVHQLTSHTLQALKGI